MAIQTVRGAINTRPSSITGGFQDANLITRDLTAFMDAIDRTDTPFLDSLSKGGGVNQFKHEWGIRAITPRPITLAAGINNSVTSIAWATGHGSRLQQGHLIRLEEGGNVEHIWVKADPTGDTTPVVKRGFQGTTAYAFTTAAKARAISIAMPENSDHPIAPITTGDNYFNYPQRLAKMIPMDRRAIKTPRYDYDGNQMERAMLDVGSELKVDLENALIVGRRHAGDPNPASTEPSTLGGLLQFCELSGNVYNLGGALLNVYHFEEALAALDLQIGANAGTKILGHLTGKRIINRLMNNRRDADMKTTSANLTWDKMTIETGTYEFTHSRNMPENVFAVYNPKWVKYRPYDGLDWHEEELPHMGDYERRSISGDFTMEAMAPGSMALIQGFNIDLSLYPTI